MNEFGQRNSLKNNCKKNEDGEKKLQNSKLRLKKRSKQKKNGREEKKQTMKTLQIEKKKRKT